MQNLDWNKCFQRVQDVGLHFPPLFPCSGWHVFVFLFVRPPRTLGRQIHRRGQMAAVIQGALQMWLSGTLHGNAKALPRALTSWSVMQGVGLRESRMQNRRLHPQLKQDHCRYLRCISAVLQRPAICCNNSITRRNSICPGRDLALTVKDSVQKLIFSLIIKLLSDVRYK